MGIVLLERSVDETINTRFVRGALDARMQYNYHIEKGFSNMCASVIANVLASQQALRTWLYGYVIRIVSTPSVGEVVEKRTRGIISTLVGASLWGFSGTCSQYLLAHYAISSLFITMVRMVGAGALFLPVILLRSPSILSEIRRDGQGMRRFIAFGLIGLYASQITYVVAIAYTNAGTATVLQSTSIVLIMLATCVIAHRLPRSLELAGLVLAFGATVVIATQGDLSGLKLPFAGLVWGFLSAVGAACYSMLPRPLYARWSSFTVVGIGMVIGGFAAIALWLLAFPFPAIDLVASAGNPQGTALLPALDGRGILVLAIIVVFGTFGAYYLFLNGISLVGAVSGSQLGAIEPVSATVCSAVLMGTAFSVFDWIGLVLMVGTIVMVAAASGQRVQGETLRE